MILKEVYDKTLQHFTAKNFASPRMETDLLLSAALKWERIDLYTKFELPLNKDEVEACREYIRRRMQNEPLAYICGHKYFYKECFLVNPHVLIPRPDSEILVEEAVDSLNKEESFSILDLGAGSGCLGLSLLGEFPNADLVAVEKSVDALTVLTENTENLGLKERTQIQSKDLFNELPDCDWQKVQLVVSSPPYIAKGDTDIDSATKDFEPAVALYAEDNGLAAYKDWFLSILEKVDTDTLFLIEFGHRQKPELESIIKDWPIKEVEFKQDLAAKDRMLKFRKA